MKISKKFKTLVEDFINENDGELTEMQYQQDMEQLFENSLSDKDCDISHDELMYYIDQLQVMLGIDCSLLHWNKDEEEQAVKKVKQMLNNTSEEDVKKIQQRVNEIINLN